MTDQCELKSFSRHKNNALETKAVQAIETQAANLLADQWFKLFSKLKNLSEYDIDVKSIPSVNDPTTPTEVCFGLGNPYDSE